MKHKTLAEWQTLVTRQQSSGLTIVDFCQEHKIATSSFYKFRKRLQHQECEPAFIKVSEPTVGAKMQPTVSLTYGDISLSFSSSSEPAWLANFVKALQS